MSPNVVNLYPKNLPQFIILIIDQLDIKYLANKRSLHVASHEPLSYDAK